MRWYWLLVPRLWFIGGHFGMKRRFVHHYIQCRSSSLMTPWITDCRSDNQYTITSEIITKHFGRINNETSSSADLYWISSKNASGLPVVKVNRNKVARVTFGDIRLGGRVRKGVFVTSFDNEKYIETESYEVSSTAGISRWYCLLQCNACTNLHLLLIQHKY